MDIILNTQSGSVLVSYKGRKYGVKRFTHPIRKTNLYMFEASTPILEDSYPLHGVMSKKKKYANIFEKDMQNKIENYLKHY